MMQAVMKAMHEVPEIEASWIAKPDADGSVTVPDALRPYLHGRERIG